MKKILLVLLLPLTFVANAREKDVEKVLGTYWNSFSNRSLQVSAIVDEDDELKLFLEIPVYEKNIEKMKIEIDEENIPLLREELLRLKDERWRLYTKFKQDGRNYYIADLKDFTLPPIRVKWLVDEKWHTSRKDKCVPVFEILNGRYLVYFKQPLVEKITGAEIGAVVGFTVLVIIGSFLGNDDSGETLNEQASYNPPQSSMIKASSPVKVNKLEYRWGFSTQDDIKAMINWLDAEKLKSKYKAKK